jgi:hypothetical protein
VKKKEKRKKKKRKSEKFLEIGFDKFKSIIHLMSFKENFFILNLES